MDEFFVGYLPASPPGIRRRVRATVALLFLFAASGAIIFAASQTDFANSYFDFGKPTEFSGHLLLQPYPVLLAPSASNPNAETPYLLVAPGKFAADSLVDPYSASNSQDSIRLRGMLIHRAEGQMLEIVPGTVALATSNQPAAPSTIEDLGEKTLTGEIVDTKCYLGVMNPGEGKVHRDCAARCLSGGIPPALITHDVDGSHRIVLLTDANQQPLPKSEFLDHVGQPVSAHGRLVQSHGLYYLRVSGSIRPLP
jgi:hypothetical protein